MRAVDRLRALEEGAQHDALCATAAGLLVHLGQATQALDYEVTTVARRPDDATAWAYLASLRAGRGAHADADEALARACAVEPTNADLLLKRAQALLGRKDVTRARPLLERLVRESWQPRFSNEVYRAKQLLDGLR